jgi:hypothetical protein
VQHRSVVPRDSRVHVTATAGSRALGDGLVRIGWALYSNSISLSAACSGGRSVLVGSGGLNSTSRSIAIRRARSTARSRVVTH